MKGRNECEADQAVEAEDAVEEQLQLQDQEQKVYLKMRDSIKGTIQMNKKRRGIGRICR